MERSLTFKTKFLNSIRSLFRIQIIEYILYYLVKGKNKESFWFHVLPNHYQYKPNTIRNVTRNGINYQLDISDIVDWFVYFDLSEIAHLQFNNEVSKSDIVVDVGANIGGTGLKFALLARRGFVYCIEPDNCNYQKLVNNINLNDFENIEAFQIAIGNSYGYTKIEEIDRFNRGRNKIDLNTNTYKIGDKVEICKLDDFVIKHSISKIDILKIDVEGYEYEVLKGCKNVLRSHHPKIMLELDQNNLLHFRSSIQEVVSFLSELHYDIYVPDLDVNLTPGQKINYSGFHYDVICVQSNSIT